MYIPIRCFTCNKTLGHLSDHIDNLKKINEFPPNNTFFQMYGIRRYCCKMILMSSVDVMDNFSTSRDNSYYEHRASLNVPRILTTD